LTAPANVKLGAAQIIGSREEQQDAFGFTDKGNADFVEHGGVLAVVADGIGGHAYGGEASRLAVEVFIRDYQTKPRQASIQDALRHALIHANSAVSAFAESQGEAENCGTTLVAAALQASSGSLHWISVGDSRLYFFRGKEFAQFTADANVGMHFIKRVARGVLTRAESISAENAHRLTSFLGVKKLVNVDRSIRPFPLHEGDRVVLCTDGVYQSIDKNGWGEFVFDEPQTACDRIVNSILEKNLDQQDNATVAMLCYGFKEQAKTYPAGNHTQQPTVGAGHPTGPVETRSTRKSNRWLWAVMAISLLLLLWVLWGIWLDRQNGKVVEDVTAIDIKLQPLPKPAEPPATPPKSSPKK
jgi:serine/threonine protein phosphatase PrpC